MDDLQSWIDDRIAEQGWAMVHVSGDLPDAPMWTYTAGLSEEGLPELIVFGLDRFHAAEVLGTVRDHLLERPSDAGRGSDLGAASDDEGAPILRLDAVAPRWLPVYPLAAVDRYGPDLTLLQVIVDLDPTAPPRDPALELSRLAAQPHLSDPLSPWRIPVHPAAWWEDLPRRSDLWISAPITHRGQSEHRNEVIPARWVAPDLALLLAPPMLADELNIGAIVRVGNVQQGTFAMPGRGSPALPVHQMLYVAQASTFHHLTFHRAPTDAALDEMDLLAGEFPHVHATFGTRTVHFAVAPAELEFFRSRVRPLERDGHVIAVPPYHAPADLTDHAECTVCAVARPGG